MCDIFWVWPTLWGTTFQIRLMSRIPGTVYVPNAPLIPALSRRWGAGVYIDWCIMASKAIYWVHFWHASCITAVSDERVIVRKPVRVITNKPDSWRRGDKWRSDKHSFWRQCLIPKCTPVQHSAGLAQDTTHLDLANPEKKKHKHKHA